MNLACRSKTYSDVVLVLGTVQLIESIAFGIPLSYFPNYFIGLGATVASIGLFTCSFMLTSAIMSPKIGSLTDLYGRKKIMIAGLIGDIAFGTLTGLAPSWLWLLLIRIINGAVSSAAMTQSSSLVFVLFTVLQLTIRRSLQHPVPTLVSACRPYSSSIKVDMQEIETLERNRKSYAK